MGETERFSLTSTKELTCPLHFVSLFPGAAPPSPPRLVFPPASQPLPHPPSPPPGPPRHRFPHYLLLCIPLSMCAFAFFFSVPRVLVPHLGAPRAQPTSIEVTSRGHFYTCGVRERRAKVRKIKSDAFSHRSMYECAFFRRKNDLSA